MSTRLRLHIVEWRNPNQTYLGTRVLAEPEMTSSFRPAVGETVTLTGIKYTVMGINHNLDTGELVITIMLSGDVDGGVEDL